jgi:branched-chain amino acid transport system substrate-binding protein
MKTRGGLKHKEVIIKDIFIRSNRIRSITELNEKEGAKMKIAKFVTISIFCLAICIFFGSLTSGAEEVRGVTKDSIRIGINVPLTGYAARGGTQFTAAFKAYNDYINDTGGVHGRKITLVIDDSQFDPSISLGVFKKQVTTNNIFAHISYGAPPSSILIQPAMEEKIPLSISSSSKPFCIPPKKYVLCVSTPFEFNGATSVIYIHDVLKKKEAKIGVFWRNDDFGKSVLDGVKEAASYYKYDIVAEPSYILGQAIDFASEVMKLKRANAEFVILGSAVNDVTSFLREAKNQGLKATIFGGAGPASEKKIVLQAGDAAENYIAPFATAMFKETQVPGVKKMLDISKKYGVREDILADESFYYAIAFYHYMFFVESLKAAGPNITQENFITASEKMKPFTGDGLGPTSFYTPTKHYNSDATYLGQFDTKIKDFKRITDWISPPQGLIDRIFR